MEDARPVTTIDACATEVLKRGLDDWVQAAEVASVVQSVVKRPTNADVRRVALEVIDELVRGDFMRAGDVTSDGFTEWSMTAAEAIRRIVSEWLALNRSPELGELCWLSNTRKGDQRARSAL
jgi:hypothetical protein